LLGREERKQSSCSSSNKSSSEHQSSILQDSDQSSKDEEEDNDSPYFVKITLDSWFLSHLEEPSIVESSEINGQYDVLMNNKVFKEIIRREIDMMFGADK